MKFEQLHQILEIDKQASISKAARALFIGQPALSGSLNSLEDEIGVRLFERSSSGVRPTPEGQDILQLARQILALSDQIINYGDDHSILYGEVTLLITPAYSFMYPDILMRFKENYPQATLHLQTASPDVIVRDLAQGVANIGMTLWGSLPERNDQQLKSHGLHFETFATHHIELYVAASHPLASLSHVSFDDIRDEQFVAFDASFWSSHFNTTKPPILVADNNALKRMILTENVVAMLPDTMAYDDFYCEHNLIKRIPLMDNDNYRTVADYLIYPAKRQLTLLEKNTLTLLRNIEKRHFNMR